MTGGTTFSVLIGPGQTLQVPCAGTQFYVVATPGTVLINYGQGFNPYGQGQGGKTAANISLLQIKNPASVQTVIQVFVGYDDYIDRRVIPLSIQPGIPVVQTGKPVNIAGAFITDYLDLSGTVVTNPGDGLQYFLVQRLSLTVCNVSFQTKVANPQQPMQIYVAAGSHLSSALLANLPSSDTSSNTYTTAIAPAVFNFKGGFCIGTAFLSPGYTANQLFTVSEVYQGIPVINPI